MIEPIEKFEQLLTRFENAVIDRSISNFSESIEWDYITSRAALTDAYREALEANEPRWHYVADGDLPYHSEKSFEYWAHERAFVAWTIADLRPLVIPTRKVSK